MKLMMRMGARQRGQVRGFLNLLGQTSPVAAALFAEFVVLLGRLRCCLEPLRGLCTTFLPCLAHVRVVPIIAQQLLSLVGDMGDDGSEPIESGRDCRGVGLAVLIRALCGLVGDCGCSGIIVTTQTRSSDGGFIFIRTTNNVPLFGLELFFLRSGAAMVNVAAEGAPMGITYTAPYPSSPGVSVPPPHNYWTSDVMNCMLAKIGSQAAQDIQNQVRQPTAAEAQAMKDCGAMSTAYEPLDPATASTDKHVSAKVGAVEITYYNPVTMSLLENGVHLTFVARNTGSTRLTLRAFLTDELQQAQPSWILHLYPIFQSWADGDRRHDSRSGRSPAVLSLDR